MDQKNRPLASFELKLFSTRDPSWPDRVRGDIKKHFDPATGITGAIEGLERYNVLLVITEDDGAWEAVVKTVRDLIPNAAFFTSAAIPLNRVDHRSTGLWKYMRVAVFTGEVRS